MVEASTHYVIYDHPADFPDHFVLREWTILDGAMIPSTDYRLYKTIEAARKAVPSGLTCLPRMPADDWAIAEVWL